MRRLISVLVLTLLAALTAPPAFAEGVSSKDLVPDSEPHPVKKETPAAPQATAREIKPEQAQDVSKKSKGGKLDTTNVGDIVVSGKTKDVTTFSGGKGSDTEANVGSIKVGK